MQAIRHVRGDSCLVDGQSRNDCRLTALIPARNESDGIENAIQALWGQTRRPDRIVVAANNCTDDNATLKLASDNGAWTLDLPDWPGKKAGALNTALDLVLEDMQDGDLILVQDADTVLDPSFLALAEGAMRRRVGAVGGVFYGERGGGFLGQLQRMEYLRYAREIRRSGGRAVVLSGTATLFRVSVLREVRRARRTGRIRGGTSFYSTASLTEDDEITKAVKTLGYATMSPSGCVVLTEVMETVGSLWHQRIRWQRGALENLRSYGWTRVTAPYWLRQILMGCGAMALLTYIVFMLLVLALGLPLQFSPFWTAVGGVFMVEKVVTVRKDGWRSVVVAALLIPELVYDVFQHVVYFRCIYEMITHREERWVST